MGASLGCPDPGVSLNIPCSASACLVGAVTGVPRELPAAWWLHGPGTAAAAAASSRGCTEQLTVPVRQRPAVTPQLSSRGSLPSSAQLDPEPCAGPFWGCRGAQRGEELVKHGGCRGEGAGLCFSAALAPPAAQRPQSSARAAPAQRDPGRCWGCARARGQCPGKDRGSREQQHENA